jgi:hypothetical protein
MSAQKHLKRSVSTGLHIQELNYQKTKKNTTQKDAEKTDFTVTITSQGVISEQFRNHALRLFVS